MYVPHKNLQVIRCHFDCVMSGHKKTSGLPCSHYRTENTQLCGVHFFLVAHKIKRFIHLKLSSVAGYFTFAESELSVENLYRPSLVFMRY